MCIAGKAKNELMIIVSKPIAELQRITFPVSQKFIIFSALSSVIEEF